MNAVHVFEKAIPYVLQAVALLLLAFSNVLQRQQMLSVLKQRFLYLSMPSSRLETRELERDILHVQQAREVMDAMQKDAHFSQIQLLKVDGGASNNNLLMQMQADALQVQHCRNAVDCNIDINHHGSCYIVSMHDGSLQC